MKFKFSKMFFMLATVCITLSVFIITVAAHGGGGSHRDEFFPFIFDLSSVDFKIVLKQVLAVLPYALPISLVIRAFYSAIRMIRKATRGKL